MRRFTTHFVALGVAVLLGGCGFSPSGGGGGGGRGGPTGLGGIPGGGRGGGVGQGTPCTGIACQQATCKMGPCMVPACTGGATQTTISGTIRDPAGRVPLYNITVYVPNKPLDPIADGPSCDPCDPATGTSLLSGEPIAIAKTDVAGNFTLGDVPVGSNIPVVIQVGKWRREITIANVPGCTNTAITDANLLRLPANQSEGHLPKMALTTGNADALECLLRKIGISDSEFTPESGSGRVNFFAGGGGTAAYAASLNGGAAFTSVRPWWDSLSNLMAYDIVLHSCEGGEGSFSGTNGEPNSAKSQAARDALMAFADMGGRVFASHWHVYWFERGPAPFRSIATFTHRSGLPNPYNATVDNATLSQWLVNVGASTTPGILPLAQEANQTTVDAVAGGNTSQRWIYAADRNPQAVQYLTATTPIPGGTCGRVVLSDIHVSNSGMSGGASDMPNTPFPSGCVTTELSPQEKALEFMLFDIASCVGIIVP
jgi:hypothetical protein